MSRPHPAGGHHLLTVRDTKLVLIEGLPGSGKTTTAEFLAAALRQRGFEVACFLEDQADHPINVGGALHPAGHTPGSAFFGHYNPDTYVVESLERWRGFVTAVVVGGPIQIFESYPFQNSVRILLQMDAPLHQIRAYAAAVEDLVQPLRPVLVYLDRHDQATSLRTIAAQRGVEWAAYVAELITDSPRGRRLGLKGLEDALTFIGDYHALVNELLGRSRLPRLVLEDCAGQWNDCHKRILDFLEVSP